MILNTARIVEAALMCVVIFVAFRSPRHRAFAAWIALTLAYSLADQQWITPVLGRLPRPFVGSARWLLHASQLLYIAAHVTFASVVFALARVRRSLRPLPWFVGFVAFVMLIGGYSHSPGQGLYRAMGFTFRSHDVYLTVDLVVNFIVIATIAPRWRLLFDDCRSTDDYAALESVIALEAAGVVASAFDLFHVPGAATIVPASLLLAYAFALGVHAPVAYLHLLGNKSAEYVRRSALAHRREGIYEMGRRLAASRAAFAAACRKGEMTPDAFPTAAPLVQRASLTFEFLALVMEDRALAAGVDFVLAAVWGLGAVQAADLLAAVDHDITSAMERMDAADADPFPWLDVFRDSDSGRGSFLEPISMPLYSLFRDFTWAETRKTMAAALKIAERVATARQGRHGAAEKRILSTSK